MDSSDRLLNRQRTVHDILGGGLFADVVLWRKKNVTMRILLVIVSVWVVFEISKYTLLSLVSRVLLLLSTILFLWAKSASLLNRPAPPLPELQLSEEMMNDVAGLARTHINALLSAFQNIALGKDSLLYFKVAASMLLISIIGGLTDFVTLGYTCLVILLTVPALYEKYENRIDNFIMTVYSILRQSYVKLDEECLSKAHHWILEKKKLS